jgi:hypothetical protein
MTSRRTSLPGAAELFRTTTKKAEPVDRDTGASKQARPASINDELFYRDPEPAQSPSPSVRSTAVRTTRRRSAEADRAPSGRERHDEKITVYCSPEELLDLESARLHLRAEHGLAVDRGRIVREALAVVLADLEAKGESSILVRRLREA